MPHLPPITPAPTAASVFSQAPVMTPAIQVPTHSGPRDGPDIPGAGKFKAIKLRLELRDLSHPGSAIFLSSVNAAECLAKAVQHVLALLYESPTCPTTTIPTTRSVTVILRSMSGVAYTTGSELDSDHKEIHFSTDYISNIHPISRRSDEINGVLTHELVHCLQYNGHGHCPGGLIEGIADWVRLHCLLSPPHWKRESGGKWDAGYQQTAYFLDYLEERFGKGTIRRLNEKLRIQKYEEKSFWTELVGRPVEQLWDDYKEKLES
ncbi:unnamed protein product [Fusarium graminearum]|uniref:Chromosome 3, complete genome n=2 Tax=Gibberella zeae TaxID=5518 RepID=I1RQ54_GIBZE|nr:hypothetical protein FGSG_06190 [Fusarium graminearum PH-1]EYB33218.1 hypothetical protein FG05_06190 [Fusarium graminearum]ESU12255.1 hypothetical protein FGSG_06190 [Fusarium graminearum PH-1]KAI6751572.1 hypothetical protein HG531_006268 [Fusarium graminearum]PCD19217.1 hypothetical protein FGRA07_06022 [Fusarium graminearum]CAF3484598.1 unnamed protein product [Fusarium graminearum]|eukprot:XP_011324831.1 hypothetical protein FGSG_06190 [Fusarium graminearum PH-1]